MFFQGKGFDSNKVLLSLFLLLLHSYLRPSSPYVLKAVVSTNITMALKELRRGMF